jgi:Flp pilus assembly protein TadD
LANDFESGFEHLRKAAALAPNVFDYQYRLGSAELEMKNFDAAAADLKRAVALNASLPQAWISYGVALHAKNEFAAAADAYAHAIKLDPANDKLRNDYGAVLVEARQPDRAIEEAEKILARGGAKPEAKVAAQMNIGYACLKTGKFDSAEKAYRAALALDPDSPAVIYNLAIALKMEDRLEASQVELRRAINLKPDFAEAYYSLGIITLKQSGDLEGAMAALNEAIHLDPTTPGPFNTLGQILKIKGDQEGSERAFAAGAQLRKDREGELSKALEQGMRGGTFPKPIATLKP